jgi:hypothetical protein
MPNMRDGFRYALLLAAGLVAVLFIVAFTAWGLTTYGSVRHVVGDLAAQPDKAADLRDQFEEMATQFSGGASSFTYYFRSAPITVAPAQVTGMGESEVISLVLDIYTSGLYDNSLQSGGLGAASVFVGSTGNLLYAATALVFAIAFILFNAGAVRGFAELPLPFKLKSAGKIIAAFCAVVFFIFALLPGLLKSLFWGPVGNNSAIRDALNLLEPLVVGSLLRNTLLVILIAGVIYVAGIWLSTKGDVRAMFKTSRASAQKENVPENRKRRSL